MDLLVVDLDNTLYDWTSVFVPALYDLARVASQIVGIGLDAMLDELRAVHRFHADIEHPFALIETASVRDAFGGCDRREVLTALDPAFLAFNRARKRRLHLYEGVECTLSTIREGGVPIVAYTDARVVNALFRIRKLRLRRFLSGLYAPASLFGSVADDGDGFLRSLHPCDLKPNPDVLLRICADHGTPPDRTAYVGDSLARDVRMAVSAGCHSVWARYGTLHAPGLLPMLQRVSHRETEGVEPGVRLEAASDRERADFTLGCFAELLDCFVFGGPDLPKRGICR